MISRYLNVIAVTALIGSAATPLRRDVLRDACAIYREHYPAANDRVRATFEVIGMTGWAPDS